MREREKEETLYTVGSVVWGAEEEEEDDSDEVGQVNI